MSAFWVLENPRFQGELAFGESLDPVNLDEGGPRCSSCGAPLTERRWSAPRRVRFFPGSQSALPGDLVFGDYEHFLARRRVVDLWEKEGLLGIEGWEPVEVLGCANGSFYLPVFPEPSVRADLTRMEVLWTRPPTCSLCSSGVHSGFSGVEIDAPTWHGQDLFELVNFPGVLVVSEALVLLFNEKGVSNAKFVKSGAYSRTLLFE